MMLIVMMVLCSTLVVEGCLDINYQEYNSDANVSNEALCLNLSDSRMY